MRSPRCEFFVPWNVPARNPPLGKIACNSASATHKAAVAVHKELAASCVRSIQDAMQLRGVQVHMGTRQGARLASPINRDSKLVPPQLTRSAVMLSCRSAATRTARSLRDRGPSRTTTQMRMRNASSASRRAALGVWPTGLAPACAKTHKAPICLMASASRGRCASSQLMPFLHMQPGACISVSVPNFASATVGEMTSATPYSGARAQACSLVS